MAVERLVIRPGDLLSILTGEGGMVEVGRRHWWGGLKSRLVPGAWKGEWRPGGELEVGLHLLQGCWLLGKRGEVRSRREVNRRQRVGGEKGRRHIGDVRGALAECEG